MSYLYNLEVTLIYKSVVSYLASHNLIPLLHYIFVMAIPESPRAMNPIAEGVYISGNSRVHAYVTTT